MLWDLSFMKRFDQWKMPCLWIVEKNLVSRGKKKSFNFFFLKNWAMEVWWYLCYEMQSIMCLCLFKCEVVCGGWSMKYMMICYGMLRVFCVYTHALVTRYMNDVLSNGFWTLKYVIYYESVDESWVKVRFEFWDKIFTLKLKVRCENFEESMWVWEIFLLWKFECKCESDLLWDVKMLCVILDYHEIWMPLNVIVVDLWDGEVCCEHRVLIL